MTDDPLIRDISDTARWMAVYRADETAREDAAFRDPYARALAGERGERIAKALSLGERDTWPFIARTYLFDQFVAKLVRQGTDLVVNLAAGLDARPYRMELPPSLRWVEVDLAEILDYKKEVLAAAKPTCAHFAPAFDVEIWFLRFVTSLELDAWCLVVCSRGGSKSAAARVPIPAPATLAAARPS